MEHVQITTTGVGETNLWTVVATPGMVLFFNEENTSNHIEPSPQSPFEVVTHKLLHVRKEKRMLGRRPRIVVSWRK